MAARAPTSLSLLPAARGRKRSARRSLVAQQSSEQAASGQTYDVVLPKPVRAKFARGNDGAAYIEAVDSEASGPYEEMMPGDKVLKVSASFGDDVWDARNYSQVKYAIKNRNGDVYLQLERRGGDLSIFEPEEEGDKEFLKERGAGDVGNATVQKQYENFKKQRELSQKRRETFEEGIKLFESDKQEQALSMFRDVIESEPPGMGDNYYKTTDIGRLAQYNCACCLSRLGRFDEALSTLRTAFEWGFDDYGKARNDPSLSDLRDDDRFHELLDEFDEPVINKNAIRALQMLNPFNRNN